MAGDNDRQTAGHRGREKCFTSSFNGINRTVNRIQLKLVHCKVSPQWFELHGYIKDYFKDDGFFKLEGEIGITSVILHP